MTSTSLIATGDVVSINDTVDETLLVTNVTVSGSTRTVTFTRGYAGTTATAHNSGKQLQKERSRRRPA